MNRRISLVTKMETLHCPVAGDGWRRYQSAGSTMQVGIARERARDKKRQVNITGHRADKNSAQRAPPVSSQ